MAGQRKSLAADEGLEQRRHRHWYDRLMMLSDGVFAIAITFLAADVSLPSGWAGDWTSLWGHLAPQLDAYATSFLVISVYWLAHRRFMAMIVTVDAPVTVLNLIMLGLIALLPAATRLVSTYSPFPIARMVYAALVIAIGLSVSILWAYAALIARSVHEELAGRLRWFLLALMVLTPPAFLALTLTLPELPYGAIPIGLFVLFLIGWRARLLSVRLLGGKPHHA